MEKIILDNETIDVDSVSTGFNTIIISVTGGNINELYDTFLPVTQFKVSGDDIEIYGIYANLKFISAKVDAQKNVTLTMSVMSDIEKRVEVLESKI